MISKFILSREVDSNYKEKIQKCYGQTNKANSQCFKGHHEYVLSQFLPKAPKYAAPPKQDKLELVAGEQGDAVRPRTGGSLADYCSIM